MNRRTLGCLFEMLETLLLTLVIFLVIQVFIAQPYQVPMTSMENTLMPGQYVLVDKLTPNFDDYHRGDIVVFNPPPGAPQNLSGIPYLKRVIGVPGDTVDIHGGLVYVNGKQIAEAYVYEKQTTDMPDGGSQTWTIAPNQLFVMDDHRRDPASQDSRDFGPIAKSSVIGRAWLRYWPLGNFGLVPQAKQSSAPGSSPVPSKVP